MRRRIGFFAVCVAYCMIILDGAVLNVAVPAIRRDLGTSMATVQWVLDGYTLPLAGLLLTAGVLGDRFGLRRMLLAGTVVFTAASAACALAPDAAALIASRAVQGIGAASLLPATLALIPHMYDSAAERARAAVIWVAAGSLSVAAAPLIGGVLIDAFGWRSIFVINLPLGVLSLMLGWRTVPATPVTSTSTPLDQTGPVMAAGTLGLIAAGLILGGADGWGSPVTAGLLAAGVVAAVVFAAGQRSAERRGLRPMVPPSFFRERVRAVSVLSAGLMGFAFYGTLLTMSVYYQQVRGYAPGGAGLALLPLTAGSAIGPLVAYRPLARRFGHGAMLLAGFACAACGAVVLATIGTATSYQVVCAGLLLVGGASTIAFSALTSLLMARVPPAQSGLASGLQNTARQSGALFAVSLFGSVLNAAEPAGRIPAAFAIAGAATVAGMACGAVAIRAGRIRPETAVAANRQVKR